MYKNENCKKYNFDRQLNGFIIIAIDSTNNAYH